jgi:patatin-like phospholipase/acyl hydrolase
MSLIDRIGRPGQKKLLSIDGGGIRGVLALGPLKRIEEILRTQSGKPDLRLADYFDYISGTSTGGIIAAGLSIGMAVDDILKFYEEAGAQMFVKANLLKRLRLMDKFNSEPLAEKLREVFGVDTLFGSPKLQTLLMMVMRNASTDSPWPLSNNPYAKYNDAARSDDNLKFPLWQLVRASTAAPTYFPPEVLVLSNPEKTKEKQFVFVDGGVTMYNDPAFQMFLMATLDRYWAKAPEKRWKAGVDKMLIVSVGTGTAPDARNGLEPEQMNLIFNATTIPSALMFGAQTEQDLLCRVFGNCLAGGPIDRELDTLIPCAGPLEPANKLFTYMRYDAELTRGGLDELGCRDIQPETVQKLDSVDGIPQLKAVGAAVAGKVVPAHFSGFPA